MRLRPESLGETRERIQFAYGSRQFGSISDRDDGRTGPRRHRSSIDHQHPALIDIQHVGERLCAEQEFGHLVEFTDVAATLAGQQPTRLVVTQRDLAIVDHHESLLDGMEHRVVMVVHDA